MERVLRCPVCKDFYRMKKKSQIVCPSCASAMNKLTSLRDYPMYEIEFLPLPGHGTFRAPEDEIKPANRCSVQRTVIAFADSNQPYARVKASGSGGLTWEQAIYSLDLYGRVFAVVRGNSIWLARPELAAAS